MQKRVAYLQGKVKDLLDVLWAVSNIVSFRGRAGEIVETLSCLQETTWKDSSARFIWGKFSGYKVIRIGNDKAIGDVGVFLHSSDWKFIWSEVRVRWNCYDKAGNWESLLSTSTNLSNDCILFSWGDFNGHVVLVVLVMKDCMALLDLVIGTLEMNGFLNILEYPGSKGLTACNLFFQKRCSHILFWWCSNISRLHLNKEKSK